MREGMTRPRYPMGPSGNEMNGGMIKRPAQDGCYAMRVSISSPRRPDRRLSVVRRAMP